MDFADLIGNIVPITLFNKGKSSQQFSKVSHNETLVVVKNNSPVAVIVPPKEYQLLRQLFNACKKNAENDSEEKYAEKIKNLMDAIAEFDESRDTI